MQKILVPCDFSPQAISAFRFAIDIAKASGKIHLLNVVELPVLHDSILMPVLSFEQQLLKDLRKKATDRFKKLTEKYSSKNIKTSVVMGATSRMILDYIKKNKIDLVIMGTQGSSGLRELVVGSNTEKIVRNSAAPVIAVKKYFKHGSIKNIVFPNTLDTEGQKDLVMKVKTLQAFFKARLHLLWVNTPADFSQDIVTRQRMKDFIKHFGLKNYTSNIFNDLYEEQGIMNFTRMINAGMIAMGTHGRKGLVHAFNGSLTEDIVNHVEGPIWTYTLQKKH